MLYPFKSSSTWPWCDKRDERGREHLIAAALIAVTTLRKSSGLSSAIECESPDALHDT
jgi:hypothetical protein